MDESPLETPDSILAFWFGTDEDDVRVIRQRSALWWSKKRSVDAELRARFTGWTDRAAAGELSSWLASPRGRLALILLCDQFPRAMYRDTAHAFDFDPFARAWCVAGLDAGADRFLRPIERVFFYLPLEHVESLADQDRAVALFEDVAEESSAAAKPAFEGFLDYARRHRDIIARFGRFPHRNRLLGRPSSEAELAFLGSPGSSF